MSPVPPAVRALVALLAVTAAAAVAVELVNWAYAADAGWPLTVRTGWALLRGVGFLVLIRHVRRGRAGARPFGLILAVTTVLAVGRLLVPRSGLPALPGVLGFAVLVLLCLAVVLMLYRSPAVIAQLSRPPRRLVAGRGGLEFRDGAVRHVDARALTARVAAFAYGPLMLVPAAVAVGEVVGGRVAVLPVVVAWFALGIGVSYAVLLAAIFLLRGHGWARRLLVAISVGVLVFDLPLCWWLLGVDGLVRDGGPLVVAAGLALYALRRGGPRRTAAGGRADAAFAAAPTRP
ncbi:hypothetical protein GCM10010123_32460 [Pilimelia anulata]|uniref:Uncharacterized protein n=1 Tax=Pilimelia anulata TaxID=53371 RepID=A0A8J3BDW8_9ACTN|nr:hypothetical protein [Pilimelia anulata]GGK00100.1 hypothetical protein GCM10010123_32460 [Pilimelia anulata]